MPDESASRRELNIDLADWTFEDIWAWTEKLTNKSIAKNVIVVVAKKEKEVERVDKESKKITKLAKSGNKLISTNGASVVTRRNDEYGFQKAFYCRTGESLLRNMNRNGKRRHVTVWSPADPSSGRHVVDRCVNKITGPEAIIAFDTMSTKEKRVLSQEALAAVDNPKVCKTQLRNTLQKYLHEECHVFTKKWKVNELRANINIALIKTM